MSKRKKIVVSICCVAAAGVVGLGAYRIVSRGETAPVSAQPSQVIVQAQLPQSGEISHSTEFIGTVEPDEVVTVTPKVSGTVLKTYFEVGDTVKKGDLLYELDPVDIQPVSYTHLDVYKRQVQPIDSWQVSSTSGCTY